MQFDRKIFVAVLVFMLATLAATSVANAQEKQSRLAHAQGTGILKVGAEEFKISSVVVKLMDDRTLEVILVSEITVFLSGTWSNRSESEQEFDLEITGGASRGGLQATGKALLSSDGKSVARLTIKGISLTTKRVVAVEFEGK